MIHHLELKKPIPMNIKIYLQDMFKNLRQIREKLNKKAKNQLRRKKGMMRRSRIISNFKTLMLMIMVRKGRMNKKKWKMMKHPNRKPRMKIKIAMKNPLEQWKMTCFLLLINSRKNGQKLKRKLKKTTQIKRRQRVMGIVMKIMVKKGKMNKNKISIR